MIAGVAAMCATAFLTSCSDYLDTDKYFKDQQSLEHIFNNKNNTLEWLALSYSRLQRLVIATTTRPTSATI